MEGRCRFGRARGTASGSRGDERIETPVNYVRINNNMDIVTLLGGPYRMFNNAGVACTHHPFPSPFVSIAIRVRSFGGIDADIDADNRVRERKDTIMYTYTRTTDCPLASIRLVARAKPNRPIRPHARRFFLSVAPRSPSRRRLTSLLRCHADNPDGVSSRRCNRPSIIRRRGWISALIVAVTGNGRHRRDGERTSARARQKDNGSYRGG